MLTLFSGVPGLGIRCFRSSNHCLITNKRQQVGYQMFVFNLILYSDQLLLTACNVHIVYLAQLLGAAHYIHFIFNHDH